VKPFSIKKYVASIIALVILGVVGLTAQTTSVAQIAGIVKDATGAVVSGAKVTATQTATGFSRSATTGPDGAYVLPNLPVGPYQLRAAASGFKTYVHQGLVLQVNDNISQDFTLQLGQVNETVEVSAAANMVQTRSNAVSQVIEQRRVEELPLNGRDPSQLILLSGAAVTSPPSDFKSSKNYPSSYPIAVAGGQPTGTYYLLDGGEHYDPFTNVNFPLPFPDVLQEFSVQTSTVPAEYGGHPGGVVNVVTKSGTNQIHGDLFEYLRNGATNAKNYFAAAKDTLKRNQFGGTIGGPIRKDKLFFFAGYQGTRIRTAPGTSTFHVPTAAVLSGDFSTIESAACTGTASGRTLTDPATGQPFANNFIDPARFNQQALNTLNFVPVSSDPCGLLRIAIPNPVDEDQIDGRIDWNLGTKNSLYGRYFVADYRNPGIFDGKDLLLTTRYGVKDRVQSLVLGDTYTISPNLINSLHLSASRGRINRGGAPNVPSAADVGLTNILSSPGNFPYMGVGSYFSLFCGICSQSQLRANILQASDDVSWTHGRHQFGFGVNVIHHQYPYTLTTGLDGQYYFINNDFTSDALADFMLGLPYLWVNGNINLYNAREMIYGLYAQDTYRVTSRLTLNLGLRWQPYLPMYDGKRMTHFDFGALAAGQTSTVFTNAPAGMLYAGGDSLNGTSITDTGTNAKLANFEPRVGFSWDPTGSGHWSIRASYGSFVDLPDMHFFDRASLGPPWGTTIQILNPTGGFSDPYQGYPGGNPFPIPTPPPSDQFFPLGGQYITLPLHIKPMNTQQWNLAIQRQLGSDWLFSASYIGNKSTHRWINVQEDPSTYIPGNSTISNSVQRSVISQVNPTAGALIGSLIALNDGANANYHALLLSANHRLSRNFSVLANYTWSHCISEGDFQPELVGSGVQNPFAPLSAERGNCDTDVRHIFNFSFLATTPKFEGAVAGRLLAHWELAGIIGWRTGLWLTPLTGTDSSLTNVGSDRPNVVGDPKLSNPTIQEWFNTGAYQINGPGTYGDAAPFSIEGPGAFTFDASLSRRFPITERQNVELRVESFNLLNHPVFGNPGTTFGSTFGRILTANDPRIWQFALKYHF